ncbi:MAG TPA: DinB family protein [Tepidiformaceae bacterium]|jgi:hypothetical protein
METKAYLKHFIDALHRDYETTLKDLTAEQLAFVPAPAANNIGFSAWHWVRTEDNIVQFVLQRANTVWLEEGLDVAWGLPRNAQGTGMPQSDAQALRLPSAAAFLDFARKVWAKTDDYLARLDDAELARIVKVQPFGEIPVLQVLGQTLISHGNQHLGEIWLNLEIQKK